ncbi:hypothetical protein [Shewanella aestuarii]|uniref:Sulfurtransferase TusA family protein n=1 Tax=Shewanella aestuarii TaxID=1028752 RepID=A0A6G9QQB9_9GAMM|nr:hypothetical protein [Shewanella aestuarii]QIR16662.1 hypothetical protein HBH39_19505 [Shewanella aestuarii]
MQIFDLKTTRCPEAMIYVRRALSSAISDNFKGDLQLRTIEQSMKRDLPYYLAQLEHSDVKLISAITSPLEESVKERWLEDAEAIEDDLLNIDEQIIFNIKFS